EVLEAGPLGDGLERLGPAEDGRAGSRQQGDVGEATALGVARVGDMGEVGEQTPRRGGGHHGTPGRARTCPVMPEIPRSLKFNLSVTLPTTPSSSWTNRRSCYRWSRRREASAGRSTTSDSGSTIRRRW